MQQEILGVECSEYMKIKSLSMSFFYIYHHLMQDIKDDRCCATFTITLTVGCLMQLNTSMEKNRKTFLSDNTIQSLAKNTKY